MVKHAIIYDINRLIVSDLQRTYDGEERKINMKILVIGNGFDLEHGLPTQYKDFLDFMQGIKLLSSKANIIDKQSFIEELERTTNHEVDEHIKEYLTQEKFLDPGLMKEWKEEEISKELIECANNNIWIKYFIENMNYEKEGWIDLESEISNVVQCFDYMKNYSECSRNGIGWPPEQVWEKNNKEEVVKKIIDYSEFNVRSFELMGKKLEEIIDMLNNHLINLIRCLEIYLEDCIGRIQVKHRSADLENFKPDKVLSFNYTKTHERYYKCVENTPVNWQGAIVQFKQYEYIHGQAALDRSKQDNNMVLGIDEYLNDEKKDKELNFIEFKKYYQRIYKRTGLEYNKWIHDIQSNSNPNKIYIFGHSLDVTDKDILYKLLIESNRDGNYNTKITIFYYDRKAYAKQIVNLIKVIGQDELIKRVSGADPTIIFKQQQKRIKRN